ncbi:MAG TPA: hypothetical protein VFD86_10720, partial [Nitrospira sp.]|nr:hypothetical protein [Nitrospira sp.]
MEFMRASGAVELTDHIVVVHTHLIQLKKLRDRLLIAFFRRVQQTPPLIHLFFFGMGSRPSF